MRFILPAITLAFVFSSANAQSTNIGRNVASPLSWGRLQNDTKQACIDIARFIDVTRSDRVRLILEDGHLDPSWGISKRPGCQITAKGPIMSAKHWGDLAQGTGIDIDSYFVSNGWQRLNEFTADGATGGSVGYFRAETFCLRAFETNYGGLDAPPPTDFTIEINCISGHKNVTIE